MCSEINELLTWKYHMSYILLYKYFSTNTFSRFLWNQNWLQKLTNQPLTVFLSEFAIQPYQSNLRCHKRSKVPRPSARRAEPSTPIAFLRGVLEMAPIHDALWVEKTPQKSWSLGRSCKLFEVGVGCDQWWTCDQKLLGKFMIDWFGSVWWCFQNRHLVSKYNSNILNCFFKHRFHTLKVTTIYLHQKTKKTQKKRKKMSRHQFKNTTGPWKLVSLKASFRYRVYSHHYLLVKCHSLLVIHLL